MAYDIKAGADLGTRLASPGPKSNLVFPTTDSASWNLVATCYRGAFIFECWYPFGLLRRRRWYNTVVPALCTLAGTKRYMSLAAGAVSFENAEAISEVVTVEKDCRSSSMDDMLVYHASICLYVGNKDVF